MENKLEVENLVTLFLLILHLRIVVLLNRDFTLGNLDFLTF